MHKTKWLVGIWARRTSSLDSDFLKDDAGRVIVYSELEPAKKVLEELGEPAGWYVAYVPPERPQVVQP